MAEGLAALARGGHQAGVVDAGPGQLDAASAAVAGCGLQPRAGPHHEDRSRGALVDVGRSAARPAPPRSTICRASSPRSPSAAGCRRRCRAAIVALIRSAEAAGKRLAGTDAGADPGCATALKWRRSGGNVARKLPTGEARRERRYETILRRVCHRRCHGLRRSGSRRRSRHRRPRRRRRDMTRDCRSSARRGRFTRRSSSRRRVAGPNGRPAIDAIRIRSPNEAVSPRAWVHAGFRDLGPCGRLCQRDQRLPAGQRIIRGQSRWPAGCGRAATGAGDVLYRQRQPRRRRQFLDAGGAVAQVAGRRKYRRRFPDVRRDAEAVEGVRAAIARTCCCPARAASASPSSTIRNRPTGNSGRW